MQVNVYLVDWPEISFREQSGPLPANFCETALEEGWVEYPPSWRDDSSLFFEEVREIWPAISQKLNIENYALASSSFDLLFGNNPPYDLAYTMDSWFFAISRDTVLGISKSLSELNFSNIQSVFETHIDEIEPRYIEDYEKDLHPYLIQWKTAFDSAKKMKWGLLGRYY